MKIRLVAAGTVLVLAAGMLSASASPSPSGSGWGADGRARPVDRDAVVAGRALAARPRPPAPASANGPSVRWPSGELDVGGAHVRFLDRAVAQRAGIDGMLLSVATPAAATVPVDYSGFSEAYGGSYGSRLQVTSLPACAATTPERAECRTATPVAATNDLRTRTLYPHLASGTTMLAVASEPSSAKGDYGATPLAASATWNVGTQSGDFAWSYPLRMPPVPGGLAPTLALRYTSSAIDGRVSSTNNQGAWVGDGFDLWSGYVERKYKACKDDGVAKDSTYLAYPADQCWAYDNATVTFGGKGGELIPVGGNVWRLRDDDGTRVEELTGSAADTGNGDNDNEYWRLTTPDGTRYYFGKNRWSGWASGTRQTNSTFTSPVYGDDSADPCHGSDFASSWCQQAWRWNLDFVEDTHGNAIAYYYSQESSNYARDLRASQGTPYTRGGWLDHVEYGLRSATMYPANPPARVDFTVAERCLRPTASDCASSNITAHPEYWEDTPWDLHCDAGQDCKDDHGTASPTFWTRKRLTGVTTKILQSNATYRPVDTWTFEHAWGTADVDRQLLLSKITNTGVANTPNVTLPPVTFAYTQLENRVDQLGDDVGPIVKNRIGAVYNEYGGQLDVNYSAKDCTPSDLPSIADNHRRCFPTFWTKTSGDTNPTLDWFHKYVVTQLVQTDLTGRAPDTVTDYDYSIGQPAWHYTDDDGLTPEKYKTWSQWHGYSKVGVKTADGGRTDYWYFQGMDADRGSTSGGTKAVSVSDGEGGSYPDHEALQGRTLKTIAYHNGAATTKTVTTPWHRQTASRSRSWGVQTANLVGVQTTRTMTLIDSGWREARSTTTSFDLTTGQPAQVDDAGDVAVTGDEACTATTFTADGTRILARVAEVRTVAVGCATTPNVNTDVITDTRSYYDNLAFAAAPTLGNVTSQDKAVAASSFLTTTRTSYDSFGRTATITDAVGGVATTTYTDTAGLNTRISVTTPPATLGNPSTSLTTVKDLDPAWGSPLKDTDAGSKVTTTAYDAFGRVLKVWAPGRSTSSTPDREFVYLAAANSITAVGTKTLTNDGGQLTSYTLYDGWLRIRQVQSPGGDTGPTGRLIADTFYNSAGKADHSYDPYYADGAPQASVFGVAVPGQIETQHWYGYDDLGRETVDRLLVGNSDTNERWRTTYDYGGNWTRVTPPTGGVVTTTFTDAHDRNTLVTEGPVQTTFGYDSHNQLAAVTGPGGATWSYGYDYRGRKAFETDPDTGTTRYTYDDLDRVTLTQDARGTKIATSYDGIGRKSATYDATSASPGTKVAEWAYDTSRKGQLYSSTRWSGGNAYTTQIDFYDNLNRPTRTRYILPAAEGALAPSGGWVFNTTYNLDGTIQGQSLPGAGDLVAETVTSTYDSLGRLTQFGSNLSSYITGTTYSKTGKVIGQKLSTGATTVDQTSTYEPGTQRLQQVTTTHTGTSGTDRSVAYTYADAGNITQIVDTSRDGVDNQCFRYDGLSRLTNAWTQAGAGTCAADPSTVTAAGIAPYKVGYAYDSAGNRTSDGGRTFSYGTGHRLVSASDGSAYGYDALGDTTYRKTPAGTQNLTWDAEAHLASVSDDKGAITTYLYTADGDRLIRRDHTGTTLYLPGQELHATGGLLTSETRYYQGIAMRTTGGVTFLINDHHGTTEVAIDAATGALSQRRYTPFGEVRASKNAWPTGNEKGFVAGTIDADAALTTLGARTYDPGTGRFISVDPEIVMGNSQQMNGYAYAGDNPTTSSDPDGTCPVDLCGLIPGHNAPANAHPHNAVQACGNDLDCQANYRTTHECDPRHCAAARAAAHYNATHPAGPRNGTSGPQPTISPRRPVVVPTPSKQAAPTAPSPRPTIATYPPVHVPKPPDCQGDGMKPCGSLKSYLDHDLKHDVRACIVLGVPPAIAAAEGGARSAALSFAAGCISGVIYNHWH